MGDQSVSPIENAVEALCKTITKKTSEYWEERNRAILELTAIINEYEGSSRLNDIFTSNIFRMLIEPVKLMILDLRSQQVRDTCTFLVRLAVITRDLMRFFLRETFESIFLAVKVPNKVMSSYVDDCIISLIRHATFKSAIPLIIGDMKDSRSKGVREHCMVGILAPLIVLCDGLPQEYANEMLLCWDIQEKEADLFQDAIRIGLEDASVRCRELARFAYLNFRDLFPRKAERIKSLISNPNLSTRLEKEEQIHDQEKESGEYLNDINPPVEMIEEVDAILQESHAINPPDSSYVKERSDRDAIDEIQALIRGNLVRRQSSRYSVFPDSAAPSKRNSILRQVDALPAPVSPVAESPKRDNERQNSSVSVASSSGSQLSSPNRSPPKCTSLGDDDGQNEFNFKVGMIASIKGKDPPMLGTVQFVGQTTFASGYWIGLRLDAPLGKNEGSVQGTQYFKCPPLHGLFVRPEQLTIISLGNALGDDYSDAENPCKSSAENLRETLNVAYALKHKLAHTMNLMNHQIEAIELFESQIQGENGVSDQDCSTFISMISEFHTEEEKVCKEFGEILPYSTSIAK